MTVTAPMRGGAAQCIARLTHGFKPSSNAPVPTKSKNVHPKYWLVPRTDSSVIS